MTTIYVIERTPEMHLLWLTLVQHSMYNKGVRYRLNKMLKVNLYRVWRETSSLTKTKVGKNLSLTSEGARVNK